jgi:hypothetical protein
MGGMTRLAPLLLLLAACGHTARPAAAPTPVDVATSSTMSTTTVEPPQQKEAKPVDQVALAGNPCDGGDVHGNPCDGGDLTGLGLSGSGTGGGGTGEAIGLGNIGTHGAGAGQGYGAGISGGAAKGPRVTIKLGAVTATSTVDQQVTHRILRRHLGALVACVEHARLADPSIGGAGTFHLTIAKGGEVTAASTTGFPAELDACFAGRLRRVAFPAGARDAEVGVAIVIHDAP